MNILQRSNKSPSPKKTEISKVNNYLNIQNSVKKLTKKLDEKKKIETT